jgi:hypothetical protein
MVTFKEDSRDFGWFWGWFIACLLAVLIVGGGLWAFGVFASGAVGAGEVHKDQNKSSTREYWVSKYNADFNKLTGDKNNIATLEKTAKTANATVQDQSDLQGAQMVCNTDVATYNGATQDLLGRKWLPEELPASVLAADYCG